MAKDFCLLTFAFLLLYEIDTYVFHGFLLRKFSGTLLGKVPCFSWQGEEEKSSRRAALDHLTHAKIGIFTQTAKYFALF